MKMKSSPVLVILLLLSLSLIGVAQTPNPGAFHQELAWSPDSSALVLSAMKNAKTDLYKKKADGNGLTLLTENARNNLWSSYSPDGRRIAFQSNRGGRPADTIGNRFQQKTVAFSPPSGRLIVAQQFTAGTTPPFGVLVRKRTAETNDQNASVVRFPDSTAVNSISHR